MEFNCVDISEMSAYAAENKGRSCVYLLRHKPTKKFYIGSTSTLQGRQQRHLKDLEKGTHHSSKLQSIYNVRNELEFHILWVESLDDARKIEQVMLNKHHGTELCLNVGDSAYGPWKVMPERNRKMISARRKGVANTPKGVPRTESDKVKIREGIRLANPNGRKGMNKGLKRSPEYITKLIAARSKAVSINGVTYQGGKQAAVMLGLPHRTVHNRLNSKTEQFKDWFFL